MIGLKQPCDQDSLKTTINKNYTLIMWIKKLLNSINFTLTQLKSLSATELSCITSYGK